MKSTGKMKLALLGLGVVLVSCQPCFAGVQCDTAGPVPIPTIPPAPATSLATVTAEGTTAAPTVAVTAATTSFDGVTTATSALAFTGVVTVSVSMSAPLQAVQASVASLNQSLAVLQAAPTAANVAVAIQATNTATITISGSLDALSSQLSTINPTTPEGQAALIAASQFLTATQGATNSLGSVMSSLNSLQMSSGTIVGSPSGGTIRI